MIGLFYEVLPKFVHDMILTLTGWRIIRYESWGAVRYQWARRYPIKH